MNSWSESIVISIMKSSWRSIHSGVSKDQYLLLVPILLNIFINDLCSETEQAFSKSEDDIKLGRAVYRPDDCSAFQTDLDRLKK